jgi:DNA-binding NarL/FixJ family response regulator
MRRQRPQRVRVLVVDGHTPSTDRLKEMVAANFEVVATVRQGGEKALLRALALRPDVILINIVLVIEDRFETMKKIIQQLPHTRVIFYQNEGGCRSCIAKVSPDAASTLGRCGFVDSSPMDCGFSDGIHGELKPRFQRVPVSAKAPSYASQAPELLSERELTDREYEVLALLAAGHPMKRIAHRLGITYRTVTFHKYRMMERLGIRTNAGLMNYALKGNVVGILGEKKSMLPLDSHSSGAAPHQAHA